MCLDVGHANVFSNKKITEWIEKMNEKIGFVHLHNKIMGKRMNIMV
jgi:sugar phosphate isomerase/epimerase